MTYRLWTPEDDAEVKRLHGEGLKPAAIAEGLDRHVKSVANRMVYLRKTGVLPGYQAKYGSAAVSFVPCITLHGDERVVREVLAEGGYPQARKHGGRTFWIKPDGSEWRHTPPKATRRAA